MAKYYNTLYATYVVDVCMYVVAIIHNILLCFSLYFRWYYVFLIFVEAANDAFRSKQCDEKVGKLTSNIRYDMIYNIIMSFPYIIINADNILLLLLLLF